MNRNTMWVPKQVDLTVNNFLIVKKVEGWNYWILIEVSLKKHYKQNKKFLLINKTSLSTL